MMTRPPHRGAVERLRGTSQRAASLRASNLLRERLPVPALAMLLVLAGLLGVAAATQGSEGDPAASGARTLARSPAGAPASKPNATAPPLFRIVGCRARTGGAFRHGPGTRAVAIGFDDGPVSDTAAFVGMLERVHARATFFMIGRQLGGGDRSLLLRELRGGDALGDHSFTHPYLTGRNVGRQLRSTLDAIRSVSGYTPCVFRPPYGSYDGAVLRGAAALGLATVLWDVDPRDWAQPGSGAIERTVLAQVHPGAILISHDGGGPRGQTLAAYPRIISALRARGYRIVTIPELLGFRPIYRRCGGRCLGLGVRRSALPAGAIVEPGQHP